MRLPRFSWHANKFHNRPATFHPVPPYPAFISALPLYLSRSLSVRKTFDNFANIDQLDFKPEQLDVSKERGKIVVSFDYDKRIPLFGNVSLVINYKGSTAD